MNTLGKKTPRGSEKEFQVILGGLDMTQIMGHVRVNIQVDGDIIREKCLNTIRIPGEIVS